VRWTGSSSGTSTGPNSTSGTPPGELDGILATLRSTLADRDAVLLFAGKDTDHTHAKVLQGWLTEQLDL
jgi:hypothetical protein